MEGNNGYEDIDRLVSNQDKMLDSALTKQNEIVDKSTQMNVQSLEKNKADIDKEVDKTNRGIYTEYRKASNPYGYNAEALASRGLGNSGYAETTQANLYNTYQKNITDTMNNARSLKADVDFQINQAMQSGDIQKAQMALDIYNQKMQLLTQEYELRNNREQYLYQKEQNALSQSNWEKEFAYQQGRDNIADERYNKEFAYQQNRDNIADERYNKEFAYQQNRDSISDKRYELELAYQKERDSIADNRYLTEWERQKQLDALEEKWRQKEYDYQVEQDNITRQQWEKEYELQKKTANSRNSSGGNSGVKYKIEEDEKEITPQQILAGAKVVQGPGVENNIYDSNSKKYFNSLEEMLNYYGYGSME